ncbi:hypothetical protein FACS189411_08010 [Bacteroidia bacterium]|nr:hypothetical protein FACS189411_08010 [Bacteroidia bacterium]
MMMKKGLLISMLAGFMFVGTACKDEIPKDPSGAVTLNMLDENNNKTWLGESDVYINKANNFSSRSCYIAEVGATGGLGKNMPPKLDNLVREAAVTPGHAYQVFDQETIRKFPSGVRSIMVGASYYRLFVVSLIMKDSISTGANVKYISVLPETYGLPEYGTKIADFNQYGDEVSIDLPEDAELFWEEGTFVLFHIEMDGGKLKVRLTTPEPWNNVGDYSIYIRVGSSFTEVIVSIS